MASRRKPCPINRNLKSYKYFLENKYYKCCKITVNRIKSVFSPLKRIKGNKIIYIILKKLILKSNL